MGEGGTQDNLRWGSGVPPTAPGHLAMSTDAEWLVPTKGQSTPTPPLSPFHTPWAGTDKAMRKRASRGADQATRRVFAGVPVMR